MVTPEAARPQPDFPVGARLSWVPPLSRRGRDAAAIAAAEWPGLQAVTRSALPAIIADLQGKLVYPHNGWGWRVPARMRVGDPVAPASGTPDPAGLRSRPGKIVAGPQKFAAPGLDRPPWFCYLVMWAWGCSSAGRALEWHSRGQGFKSPQLHQIANN
jgi:hypothetical protein